MTIKEFAEKYNAIATDRLKEDYLNNNLHIKTYLPFLTKVTLADKLTMVTTLDKDTGNVNVKSDVNYLLFCRTIIEQYTDLQVETEGFYEEYDALNESGVLFELTADFEGHPSLIPAREISELRGMIDLKQRDIMTNQYEIHSYISNQIERITEVGSVVLKPVLDKLATELENMDEKDIEKLSKILERGLKRIK